MSGFSIGDDFNVICTTPSGNEFVIAKELDPYWADRVVYALNFQIEMEQM